jgi:hypothetical protein
MYFFESEFYLPKRSGFAHGEYVHAVNNFQFFQILQKIKNLVFGVSLVPNSPGLLNYKEA